MTHQPIIRRRHKVRPISLSELGRRNIVFRAHLSTLGSKLITASIPIGITSMLLYYYGLNFTMTLLMRFALIILPAVALLMALDYRKIYRQGNTESISVHEFGFLHRRKDVFTAYRWTDIEAIEPVHFPTGYGRYVENAIIGYRVTPKGERPPLIINRRFHHWRSLSHTLMTYVHSRPTLRHFRPRTIAWYRHCERRIDR